MTLNSTRAFVTLLMALFVKGICLHCTLLLGLYSVICCFLPTFSDMSFEYKTLSALERVHRFFRGEYTNAAVRNACITPLLCDCQIYAAKILLPCYPTTTASATALYGPLRMCKYLFTFKYSPPHLILQSS